MNKWKSRAVRVGKLMTDLYVEVLGIVIQRREAGQDRGCFVDRVLDQNDKNKLSLSRLYFLGGVLMEGGSDTSSSLILAMVRALIEFPEVQKKYVLEKRIVRTRLQPPSLFSPPFFEAHGLNFCVS